MRRQMLRVSTVLVAGLLVAACGAVDDAPELPAEEPGEVEEEAPVEDGQVDASLASEVDLAVTDAAAEAGVSPEDVEVVLAEPVTWSDGAIGCPEPDGMYTQALVEGYRILLDVDGTEVAYHGADGSEPFRCDDPQEPID